MSIVIDLTQDEELLVRTVANQEGIDPTTYIANLIHRHLRQKKAHIDEIRPVQGQSKNAQRVGNLHPGNFRPGDDFDASLPDEFWFGEA